MILKDISALKEVPMFNGQYDKGNANEHFIYGIEAVMEYIDDMPTICTGCDKCRGTDEEKGMGDLIDRTELRDAVEPMISKTGGNKGWNKAISKILDKIDEMPAVDIDPEMNSKQIGWEDTYE